MKIAFVILDVLVIALWVAVIVQYISRKREITQLRESAKCPNCGKDDFKSNLFVGDIKSKKEVGLLVNIGGGQILLTLAIILLWQFAVVLMDLISRNNNTGILDESWMGRIGMVSFLLITGIGCALYGILSLSAYFGKKGKFVGLTCKTCNSEYAISETLNWETAVDDGLRPGETGLILLETQSLLIDIDNDEFAQRFDRYGDKFSPRSEIASFAESNLAELDHSVSDTVEGRVPDIVTDISDTSETTKEDSSVCPKCHREIESYEFTCPNCGHTQWEIIGFGGVLSIFAVGFVVYRVINGNTTGILFWGGVILGVLLAAVTIQSIIQAIRLKK